MTQEKDPPPAESNVSVAWANANWLVSTTDKTSAKQVNICFIFIVYLKCTLEKGNALLCYAHQNNSLASPCYSTST